MESAEWSGLAYEQKNRVLFSLALITGLLREELGFDG